MYRDLQREKWLNENMWIRRGGCGKDSKMLVMFVTPDGEVTARINSECQKIK
jgi:hypothetical protein